MVTANLQRAVTLPTIPAVTADNSQDILRSVKEILDVRVFGVADPLDQVVTFRSLYANGLATTNSTGGYTLSIPASDLPVTLPANKNTSSQYIPPPAVTGLTATATLANVILQWDMPAYGNHAKTEIWRSATNDIGTAVLVGSTPNSLYADPVGVTGAVRYYWVRNVSQVNVYGDFNATGGTSATTNQVGNVDIATGAVTYDKISVANLAAVSANMGDLTAGTITLNTTGHIKSGQTAYDTGTGFWLGRDSGTARFSLGNSTGHKLTWDGSDLSIVGGITATVGAIGGWVIGTTTLYSSTVGFNSAATGTTPAIWAGSGTPSSSPFKVTSGGIVTATSGTVGGWTLGTTSLTAGSGANSVGLDVGGTYPVFYAGNANPAIAPFRVVSTGAMYSYAGNIGGWTINSTNLSSPGGSIILDPVTGLYMTLNTGASGVNVTNAGSPAGYFETSATSVTALTGHASATTGSGIGVKGSSYAASGYGVYGTGANGAIGVVGTASGTGHGVYAGASGTGYAVYAAGNVYVSGTITGNITGSSGSCSGTAAYALVAASCTGNAGTATTSFACSGTAANATTFDGYTSSYVIAAISARALANHNYTSCIINGVGGQSITIN